jgi:RHS repeat-associated protein
MNRRAMVIRSIPLICGVAPLSAMAIEYEQVIYFHNDALGSPIAATDSDGDLLWRERYAPFGSRLLHESRETDCGGPTCLPVESAWDERLWYTGKLEETRTGLSYFGARWYEPEIGRFLSPDPVLFQEENLISYNRYAYANNNPYRYFDPDGREVAQVSLSIRLPKLFGLVQKAFKREVKVSGFGLGLTWSYPDRQGRGEYDVGVFLSTSLEGAGISTGRIAATYAQSVHGDRSVKDLAGIGGSV